MSEQTPETPAAPDAPEAPQEQAPDPNLDAKVEDSPEESDEAWDPKRAKEKIRKINSENQKLRDRAEEAEQKVTKTEQDFEAQAQSLSSENLRLKVGYELGLPLNLAVRLQGSTREEMLADAESLVELIAPTKPAPPAARPVEQLKPGATPSQLEPTQQDAYPTDFLPRAMRERLAGNSHT